MARCYATSLDGISVHYRSHSTSGIRLLFIHGLPCSSAHWQEASEHLGLGYACATLDLAGHGRSGTGRTEWTIEAFAGDVEAVARMLGDPMILVAHSLGGPVAVAAAHRLGGQVIGVMGVETFHWLIWKPGEDAISETCEACRRDFAGTIKQTVEGYFDSAADPVLVARLVEEMRAADPEMTINALGHYLRWHTAPGPELLASLDVPVITINSTRLSGALTCGLQDMGIEVVLMDKVGHYPMLEAPAEFYRLLGTQLEGLRARALSAGV
jgi:pimeloyl-ACP methyl ester carboxylesterase